MCSEWSGFTDEDLKQIRGHYSPDSTNPELQPVRRTFSLESSLHTEGRKAAFQKKKLVKKDLFKAKRNGNAIMPLTPEQSLSQPLEHPGSITVLKVDTENQRFQIVSGLVDDEELSNENHLGDAGNESHLQHSSYGDCHETSSCNCASVTKSQDKLTLEEFEQKRKHLEAENAKRKQLLLEALDDRKKRTREEAKKIAKIQTELGKLDSLLSCDVGILRNQIEMASLEFTAAQKRYEKAEREFVEAKFALFQKMERKEQLTDYLCAIIEQNEFRKANKLSELMHQLDLDSLLDQCQNMETPSHPCILNGMITNLCSVAAASQVSSPSDAGHSDEEAKLPD